MPQELVGRGYQLRIGAHTDGLWHLPDWKRAPEISRVFPLTGAVTKVANPFGGAVYLVVPRSARKQTVAFTIRNAVAAPHFVRGKTSLQAWRETLGNAPAPWAELEANQCILTVPSSVVRTLDDPETLLTFWDDVMDCCADLAAIPRQRLRPERYATDLQISAGYMHSGYPIMMGLDVREAVVSLDIIKRNAHPGVWGFFHEVGHNHQVGDWTFAGTGEVTNNLFALYVFEQLCGIHESQHPAIKPDQIAARMKTYFAGGANFAEWQVNPFLALSMYMQLRQAFGWEPFKKAFGEYRTLTNAERPRTEQDKHDQWMVRFSRACGKNLAPFFQTWGVPTSQQARDSLASLPVWMPADFPPK